MGRLEYQQYNDSLEEVLGSLAAEKFENKNLRKSKEEKREALLEDKAEKLMRDRFGKFQKSGILPFVAHLETLELENVEVNFRLVGMDKVIGGIWEAGIGKESWLGDKEMPFSKMVHCTKLLLARGVDSRKVALNLEIDCFPGCYIGCRARYFNKLEIGRKLTFWDNSYVSYCGMFAQKSRLDNPYACIWLENDWIRLQKSIHKFKNPDLDNLDPISQRIQTQSIGAICRLLPAEVLEQLQG